MSKLKISKFNVLYIRRTYFCNHIIICKKITLKEDALIFFYTTAHTQAYSFQIIYTMYNHNNNRYFAKIIDQGLIIHHTGLPCSAYAYREWGIEERESEEDI